MTPRLPALLWHAIAEVEGAIEELQRRVGKLGLPRETLGTDPETVAVGWQLARDDAKVRAVFQRAAKAGGRRSKRRKAE